MAIALVQNQTSTTSGSGGSNSPAGLAASSTPLTFLAAFLVSSGGTAFTTGPSGWIRGPHANLGGNGTAEIWVYPNNPGGITAPGAFSGSTGTTRGTVAEFSGNNISIDATGANTSAGLVTTLNVTATSSSITGNEAVIACFGDFFSAGNVGSTWTTPSGFTNLAVTGGNVAVTLYTGYELGLSANTAPVVQGKYSTSANQTGMAGVIATLFETGAPPTAIQFAPGIYTPRVFISVPSLRSTLYANPQQSAPPPAGQSANVTITGVVANVNVTEPTPSIAVYQTQFQQFQLQPDGIPYPLSMIGQLAWLPRQTQTVLPGVWVNFDTKTVANTTVASPPGSIVTSQQVAARFPYPQISPYPLSFINSLRALRPQNYSASGLPTILPGPASSVTVLAPSDGSATISVSAVANVTVTAPTPPTVLFGVAANVTVASSGQVTTDSVVGTVSSISVRAIPGSVNIGATTSPANVPTVAVNGTVTLTHFGNAAIATVTAIPGSISISAIGIAAANSVVSQQGTATVSPQGTVRNILASAVNGSVAVSVSAVGNVSVASSGNVNRVISGVVKDIPVVAVAGNTVITKVVTGVTAQVNVASSGAATITLTGAASNTTASSAGQVSRNISGPAGIVTTKAIPGLVGQITITASLINPDIEEDLLLSESGKLLDVPVKNTLITATTSPKSQGI